MLKYTPILKRVNLRKRRKPARNELVLEVCMYVCMNVYNNNSNNNNNNNNNDKNNNKNNNGLIPALIQERYEL